MNTQDIKEKIGWIGTGIMGSAMCMHLVNKGYPVTVFNRTKSKAEQLMKAGADWADSPKEVAELSDVVFTIVGFPKDVEEVYFGENGIFRGIHEGSVLVDMTTAKPQLAEKIFSKAKQHKASSVDAPVSGRDTGARNGTFSIMIGGEQALVEKMMPLFTILGKNIVQQGETGA